MPDFDKNLQAVTEKVKTKLPDSPLVSIPTPNLNVALPDLSAQYSSKEPKQKDLSGRNAEDPFKKFFGDGPVVTRMAPTITAQEAYQNRRYDKYAPEIVDMENQKAYHQSVLDKATNGVLKGANLAATTIAGGFGMLYGIGKAVTVSHKFSDVWDNEATRALDDWNTKVDQEYLPNYYTNVEKNSKWYSSDNWFKANFLWDKLVKNAGFAVGAMYSGNIANAGILGIGKGLGAAAMAGATASEASGAFKIISPLLKNMARAFSQGKNIEVAGVLEKGLTSIADVEASSSAIAEVARTTNKFAAMQDGARRSIMATYSSAGEASFEALSTGREHRANLIEQYKQSHGGRDPEGADLEKIDASTEALGAVSFLGNMALLTITEHAQLPTKLGSTYSSSKQAANSLLGEVEEVVKREGKYVKATPLTKFGKVWDKVSSTYDFTKKYIFDPKEAGQEAGQFALQVGVENYYNKAYQSKKANALVDGFLYGLFGTDESGEGKGVFNSKEGAESILLGGITGSLMQIKGNIKESKAVKSNTEKFLTQLNNSPSFKAAYEVRLAAANRGIVLQEQQQDAVMQGDKLEAKDLDADMMHNYIMPRIKYGRFDMVMDDIADLKKEGSTEKGLASLKEGGLANVNDTIQSYQKRLTSFEQIAKNTNEIFKASNLRFGGEVIKDEKGNPILDAEGKQQKKYSPQVIDKLVYAASKIADYDLRIPQVNMPLIEAGITTSQEIIDDIYKNFKVNEVAKEEALKQIDELKNKGVTSTVIDDLKTSLSEVIELAGRKKTFLEEYNAIKETPLNYQPLGGYEFGDAEETDVLVKQNISAKKRKEKLVDVPLEVGKVYSLAEPVRRDGNKLHLAPKIAVVAQTLGGEIEAVLPDGTKTFITREDFKKYNIIDESNTDEDLQKEFDASIETVLNNPKNSDLKDKIEKEVKEKLKEGEGKDKEAVYRRAVINSLDDKKLIDAIEKEFNKRTKATLEKREKERLLNEALQKGKDALDKLQDNLGLDDVGTGEDDRDAQDHLNSETNTSRLKSVGKLFHSGTTESEGSTENPKDPASSPEHINRSRRFLSKIKTIRKNLKKGEFIKAILISGAQQEKFGLNGLAQLSFNQPLDTTLDKLEDVNNVDKGIILQVFVLERGGKFYFIDEDGNALTEASEQADVNKIVFQTMPTTSPFFSAQFDKDGKPSIRYRKDEESSIDQAIADWKAMRALLIASPDASVPYEFNVSRGLAIRSTEKNHISKVLVDDNAIATNQTLIVINTTGEVVHQGDTIKFPKGRPVLQNGDTLEYINNSKFTEEQAKTLYAVIQKLTEDVLTTLAKTGNLSINKKYANYLQNVLYWKKGKTDGGNQIRIEGNKLYIGKNGYPLVGIENYKDEIIANFQEAYHNINRTTLQPDTFNEEFDEFYLDKDDKLQTRTWKKYQVYLLSDKYPDGSPRKIESTPLFTTIVPGPVSFIQKYATTIDAEYPKGVLEKKKPKEAPPQPPSQSSTASTVFGNFNFDGKTINTFDIYGLKVSFTFDVTNGKLSILLKDIPDVDLDEMDFNASQNDEYIENGRSEQEKFIEQKITNLVKPYLEQYKKRKETPEEEPTPVSIEDAIEKERKKELVNIELGAVKKGDVVYDSKGNEHVVNAVDKTGRAISITDKVFGAKLSESKAFKINPNIINDRYDAKYIDAVNKGTITKEQALQALKKAGRESSDAYKQLSAPEALAGSTDAKVDIEAKKAFLQKEKQEAIDKISNIENNLLPNINNKLENGLQSEIKSLYEKLRNTKDENSKKEIRDNIEKLENKKLTERDITELKRQKESLEGQIESAKKFIEKKDAELAALETSPVVKETEVAPVTGAKPKFGGDDLGDYRRVTKTDKKKFITDEDIERLKKWHAKNLPQIPFQVLMNLVEINSTEKAWGVYEDGIAKFFKRALKGTEYHELFHGVWTGLLTSEEKSQVMDEFRTKMGTFTDRASGKTVIYAEATDKQIEEKIADDFADFRNGKIPAKSLGGKVLNFFKRILEFFKSFVTKPSAKVTLFESIEKGALKERKYVINNIAPKYSKIEGLSEEQVNNYVKDITGRAASMIKGENDKELLFNLKKLSAADLFGAVRQEYINKNFLDPNNFTGISDVTGNRVLTQAQWDAIVIRSKEHIQALMKIRFNEEEQEASSINSENSNKNDYAKDPFSVDAKSTAPFAVKFVVNTLPKTNGKSQKGDLIRRPELTRDEYTKTTSLVNASQTFVTLLTTLSDTVNIDSFFEKVISLAKDDGDYVRYIETFKVDLKNSSIDLNTYSMNDWRYLIQTYKVFNKQRPDVLVEYVTDGETYIGSANLNSAVTKIKKQWFENIKNPSKDNPPAFVKKQGKKYIVDRDAIKAAVTTTTKDKAKFLNNLGIDITEEDIKKLDDETSTMKRVSDSRRFLEAISSIKAYLGESVELYSIKGEVLGVNGPLNTLAEMYVKMKNPLMDSTYINVDGKMRGAYAEHNYLSVFANTFNSVSTLDELLKLRPELNDEYSKNSLILKVGGEYFNENRERIKDLRVIVTEGKVDKKKGTSTSKLGLSNKTVTQININLEGNYYALVGADSTTEWGMSFGNHVSFSSFEQKNGWEKTFKIFRNYLVDEINLALDAGNRAKLEAMAGKEKDLRFFEEILSPEMLVEANKVINKEIDKETGEVITSESFLKKHGEQVDGDVKAWIDSMSNVTKKSLIESGKIVETSKINKLGESYIEYSFDSLQGDFIKSNKLNKSKLSESELTNLLSFLNVNYSINNTEYHKIIFGDPYQYKIKNKNGKITLDETKRIKLFESPRGTSFDVPELNTLLNDEYNTVTTADGEKIFIADDDYGYHLHKNHLSTITVKDVMTMGSMANALASFGKKIDKTNETDGASWLRDSAYREIKTKNGQWSPEAEAWHQWQMSYTRNKLAEKGKYDYKENNALKKHDAEVIKKDAPHHVIEVLKPIVSGAKPDRRYIDIVIDKFSQLPVYYSMVEGKAMEDFYIKMFEDKIDYAVVESGRKAGIETSYDLYVDGKINNEKFDKKINVPFSIYGIQVETSHDGKSRQTEGSQLPKVATVDIYDKGVPTSEAAKLAYEKFTEAKQLLLQNGYDELLKKLGIEEDAENEFFIRDKSVLSNSLLQEMLRRESSENAKDTLKLDENNQFIIPFEASPSYSDIRNIIFAMIGKSLTSQKVNGGPHVQVPVTMFEEATKGRSLVRKIDGVWTKISKKEYNDLSIDGKKEVMLTDNTLKFYTKEDPYCEVLLPSWFQDKFDKNKFKTDKDGTREEKILRYLNTDEGKKILTGVGFRIPTQSLSSSEVFRVKEFLPDYMGHTVVVPTEITSKAGSDFDIDKLNMYLKSVYIDANGDVKLVEYKDGEEATKEFYGKVFDETRQKEIDKIEKFDEFRNKLLEIVTKIETSSDEEVGVMSILTEEEFEFYQKHIGILSQIEDQSAEKDIDSSDYIISQIKKLEKRKEKLTSQMLSDLLRNDFINDMYRRSLENKYFEALEDIITLPENFEKLLSPVDDGGLENIADELDNLMDVKDNSVKARLLDRNWMTFLRHAFVTAKRWVGIAAVNITNHSLVQKASIYVDPAKFPENDPYLKNDEILLKHNTVEIDGKKYISLSGIKDSDGRYISEKLSGYTTSIVDVAKNPFILKIINNELIISTFMFLERIGVSMNHTAFFLNQPIIKEYLKLLENSSKKSVFDKNSIEIINNRFSTTEKDLKNASIDVNLDSLKNNISEYYAKDNKKNSKRNAEQQLILIEFLKYAKMAEYSFKFSQATNYDTTSFRSYDHYYRKGLATEKASKENIFSSVDKVLDSGFIGLQKELLGKAMSRTSAIFKLEKDDFRIIVNSVLKEYAENEYLSDDKYQTIADKLRASLIDYIAQTKGKYNQDIKSLLVELETSVSKQLQDAKSKYPTNELLQILTPSSSDRIGGANTITVKVALKEAYDQNLLTGMLRELRDDAETNNLYKDIVKLAILQGTYSSPLSIKKVIPIEDYSKVIAPLIDTLTSDDITNFTKGAFQRDNWKDDDIIPSIEPKIFVKEGSEQQADQYGNMVFEFSSPAFPEKNPLSQNKQIMILNDRYNSREIGKSFLKMRRIQQVEGSYVDMVTNQVILPSEFKERKDKGDLSLNNVIGYEQVKGKFTGKPFIHQTTSPKDGKIINNYVYKMINLRGDGMFASEHYEDNKKSVINNGTEKTDELTDEEAIGAFIDALSKDEVPEESQQQQPSIEQQMLNEFESLKNKPNKTNEENDRVIELYDTLKKLGMIKAEPSTSGGIDNSTKINIYAGTGENAELSNFANRPFKLGDGNVYPTVEHAFQLEKLQYSNAYTDEQKEAIVRDMITKSASQVKAFGKTVKGLNVKMWNEDASTTMKILIRSSFEQNSAALQKLLATGNATLTHTQDKGKWGTEFPRLLMEVREELKSNQPSTSVKPLTIPPYTVNRELKNADGTKRFAQTNGTQIILNPVNNPEEFFNYFEGKEQGPTSAQKGKVLEELAKKGYTLDAIKSILNTNKLINTFLILHEQIHIDNNDKDVYWLNSKDLLTPDKIAIEVRATTDALEKIKNAPKEEKDDFSC